MICKKEKGFTTLRQYVICAVYKGPDALDWQNLCGPTKNLDKICLCQIFNLSSVGALRHVKIFVDHKCQSHGNTHHRLHVVRGKGYMRSQESDSIKYVASPYYCLYSSFFLPWIFYSCLLLNPQLGCFQSWCNLYMHSADLGGWNTNVYLVGLHRDA